MKVGRARWVFKDLRITGQLAMTDYQTKYDLSIDDFRP